MLKAEEQHKVIRIKRQRAVLAYVAISILWIAVSERIVESLLGDSEWRLLVLVSKGWFFVAVTAVALYFLLRSYEKSLQEQMDAAHDNERIGQAMMSAIPDLVLHLDTEGRIIAVRNMQESLAIADSQEWVGRMLWDLFPGTIARRLMDGVDETLRCTDVQSPPFEFQMAVKGEAKSWEVRMARCRSDEVIAIIRDMTKYRRLLDELRYQGMNDALTGLYNRAFFEQELVRLQGYRYVPVAVIICDIDGLKTVNDRLGHAAGDRMIQAAARILHQTFRTNDVIARIGGDEFAILLPQTPQSAVDNARERLRKLEEEYNAQGPEVQLRISMGDALSDDVYADMQELVRLADNRMYEDKRAYKERQKMKAAVGERQSG